LSKYLRYQKKAIQQHLAQQYVLNHLSPLSKKRFEKLMDKDPSLRQLVNSWQEKLTAIVDLIPEKKPPKKVWKALAAQHNINLNTPEKSKWRIWVWPSSFAFVLSALLVVSFELYRLPVLSTQLSPSYIAVMSKKDDGVRFVINAYAGLTPGNSKLKIQWDKNIAPESLEELTLWSIERETGNSQEIDKIMILADQQHLLSKQDWLSIKNSKFLELRRGNRVVYKGECIQLAGWKS
jgi:anti-sigma-K factor RskA